MANKKNPTTEKQQTFRLLIPDRPTDAEQSQILDGIRETMQAIKDMGGKADRAAQYTLGDLLKRLGSWYSSHGELLDGGENMRVPDMEPLTSIVRLMRALAKVMALGSRGEPIPDDLRGSILSWTGKLAAPTPVRKPLSPTAAAVYELLLSLPGHRAMTGPEICDHFAGLDEPITVDENTLTGRFIPELKQYGVQNAPRIGYFISPESRPAPTPKM